MFRNRRERRAKELADANAAAGFAAGKRWEATHDVEDLDAALDCFNAWHAWSLTTFVPRNRRAVADSVRGFLLVTRGQIRDDLTDLDDGLASLATAMDGPELSDRERASCQRSQITGMWARATLTDRPADYDQPIALCDAATPAVLDSTFLCLMLLSRHNLTGDLADLERARALFDGHEADRRSAGLGTASAALTTHGQLLLNSYTRYGEPSDAISGIEVLSEAISDADDDGRRDALELTLVALHGERAAREGDHDARTHAVTLGESVVARDVPGKLGVFALIQLADNLVERDGPGDTDRALVIVDDISGRTGLTALQQGMLRCVSGAARLARYRSDGDAADLGRATEDYERALEPLTPEFRPFRALALAGYAACLEQPSDQPPAREVLMTARSAVDEAVELTLASECPYPDRIALRERIDATLLHEQSSWRRS